MANFNADRTKTQEEILALGRQHSAMNGCIYYGTDGGVFVGKADGSLMQCFKGKFPELLAGNLIGWAERSEQEVVDEWSDRIRTTAGALSIDSSKSAYVLMLRSKGAFRASGISASGTNLLNPSATVGGSYVFPVPKMVRGAYGNADEANGIVFCDKQGNMLHPTVRFSATYPSSASAGTAVTPYQFAGHSEYFYPSASAGYFIVSGLTVTAANACARIAWSKNYNIYEAYRNPSVVSFTAVINAIAQTHSAVSNKMLAVGNVYDEAVFGASSVAWTRRCSAITPEWTTVAAEEEGQYNHTAIVPSTNGAMKPNGAAESLDGSVVFGVDGTTVSFTDNQSSCNLVVKYELNAVATGSVSQSNAYQPDDFGIEFITDAEGDFVIRTSYYQGIPDSIFDLLSRTSTLESEGSDLDTLVDEVVDVPDYDALPMLCGQPPILFGAGAPTEANVPDNWKQFDPATGEGYNWNGLPSAVGQQYIDTSVASGGRYVAGRTSYDKTAANYYILKWYNS